MNARTGLSRPMQSLVFALCVAPALSQAAAPRGNVTIDDTGVHPESITSTRTGDLIIGSIKGRLFRADPASSVARAWVEPSAKNGLQAVFGVLAHEPTRTLWVCSVPNPFAAPQPGATNALVALDLASGAFRARYNFPPGRSVCNDMTVAPDGAVYVADTQGGRILRLAPRGKVLGVAGEDERLRGVDGIAFAGDGRLYVNNVTTGSLLRVTLAADGRMTSLTDIALSEKLGGPDGMRLIEGDRFLVAEGTAGRISEVTVQGDRAQVRVLKSGLDSSPGVTLVGDTAYAIEGKIRYLIDPKLKGQDPGPFRAIAVPLSGDPLAALPRHVSLGNQVHVSGQPTPDQLALLPAAGVRHVIDLRPDGETPDLDERMVVVHLGLDYQSLPVSGAKDLTRQNVATFDEMLKRTEGEGVLMHCGSGNRVGAMLALRARWLQGKSAEEALAIGKAAGMTGLEADVKTLFEADVVTSASPKWPPE